SDRSARFERSQRRLVGGNKMASSCWADRIRPRLRAYPPAQRKNGAGNGGRTRQFPAKTLVKTVMCVRPRERVTSAAPTGACEAARLTSYPSVLAPRHPKEPRPPHPLPIAPLHILRISRRFIAVLLLKHFERLFDQGVKAESGPAIGILRGR